jgi:hypothetical protein
MPSKSKAHQSGQDELPKNLDAERFVLGAILNGSADFADFQR